MNLKEAKKKKKMGQSITKQKRAEENKVRALALLRATLDSTADGILAIGSDRQILSFNETFVKMWRIPADILVTNDDTLMIQSVLNQLQTPEDFLAKVRHLYDHPKEESFDVLDFKDGRVFERFSRPMLVKGHPLGRVWSFRDITERKRAEARFRRLVDSNAQSVFFWNTRGEVTDGNDAFLKLVRYTREDLKAGRISWAAMTPPEYDGLDQRALEEVATTGVCTPYEKEYIRKDGTRVPILIGAATFEDKPEEGICFLLDLTERKHAEERIAQQAALIDQTHDAIILRDLGHRIVLWSKGAERVYGWTAAEIMGRKLNEVDPETYEKAFEAVLRDGEWIGEIQKFTKTGAKITVESRWTLLRDSQNRPKSILAIGTDITERKRLEEHVRQSQKMETIGQLAGGVAHDFNNILAVIQMQAGLLKMEPDLSPKHLEIANDIESAALRAANVTRQLLLFSRKQAMQMQEFELNQAINGMTKLLQRVLGEQIHMHFKFAMEPLFINADAGMLDQVIMNLAVNARDAMPIGGRLVIETFAVDFDETVREQSPQARPGSFVCVSVSDTGCGIPPEVLPRIFEPFFTTKGVGKGTGLGLATVFGIVQQHQGWISLYSEVGTGTTFKVYLPRLADNPATTAAGQNPAAPNLAVARGGETILLVEDDDAVRSVVCKTLSQFGYHVLVAVNGVEAQEVWKQHRDDIRLLLTDMVMPGGVMGKDLAKKLLADNPKLKVIYTSGYSAEVAAGDLLMREGINYLTKPYQPHKLAQIIRNCLKSSL